MNRREFLKHAAAAGVVAINGVAITEVAKTLTEPELATMVASNFNAELWSQEVIKAYKNNLVMAALLNK